MPGATAASAYRPLPSLSHSLPLIPSTSFPPPPPLTSTPPCSANEDISDAAAVEEALHTLTEARKRKLNAAMATTMRFAASSDMPEVIDMKDAGSMEVNLMRTFFEVSSGWERRRVLAARVGTCRH